MPIDGLTATQTDFIEKYLSVPKIGGRKKAKGRRDDATREFRRFNVNRDAVATRIDGLGDPALQSILRSELARAEKLIGDDPKNLKFDDAMAALGAVRKAVDDQQRQGQARQKHALMQARMDTVTKGPALDNIDEITRVWTFADATFDSGIKSNDPGKLAEAEKALDQLPALIDAGRPDINGEGRESKAKLRAISERLTAAEKLAASIFTDKHVPPVLTALFKAVHDRLADGAAADVAGLPAATGAAGGAMDLADAGAEALFLARRSWQADHARFQVRYDLMDAHGLAKEATHVAPKFDAVRTAYKAAADHALSHDYARASTDLAPLFAQIDTALQFADDYQSFLAIHDRRKAMVDALPADDEMESDEVKDAIAAARTLLTEAEAERDAGNMDVALQKLVLIATAAPKAEKLTKAERDFLSHWRNLKKRLELLEAKPDEAKALIADELKYLSDEHAAALVMARGGDIAGGANKVGGLFGSVRALEPRSEQQKADGKPPTRIEDAQAFLVAKTAFLTRLQETNAVTDADGKIAITAYVTEMNEAKTRLDKWEAEHSYATALSLANQLADVHAEMMYNVAQAKTYLDTKAQIDPIVTLLESGVTGADAAADTLAMGKRMMADALAMSQKDDWFQAARMMKSAKTFIDAASLIQKNVALVGGMTDAAVLGNIATDFDAAYAEFEKVRAAIAKIDGENTFGDKFEAAKTRARGAANALPADPAAARAEIDGAIGDCRDVMVLINQQRSYEHQADAIAASLKDLKKENKKDLIRPEIDAIQANLDAAKLAVKQSRDYKTALDEMSKAQTQVKTAFGTTHLLSRYLDGVKELEKVQAALNKPDVAPGLGTEIARIAGLIGDIRTAFGNRRMAEMETLLDKAFDLASAYLVEADRYKLAKKSQEAVKAGMTSRLAHPAAAEAAAQARDVIAQIDRAMTDHLYAMAMQMCRDAWIAINRAEAAVTAFEALRPVKTEATAALKEIEDRDDPDSGAAHEKIVALRAVFDAAQDKENMKNYTGAARSLAGFPARCAEVVPLLDAYDLYVAARDAADQAIAALQAKGTAPIAPMFVRIEKKRDNALRLAGKYDFATAMQLLEEILDNCLTADATLLRQSEFDKVMGQIKGVDDGDTDDLKAAIDAAGATLANLRSRPAALFVDTELEEVDDHLDKARADAEDDFDGALALVTSAIDDCGKLAGEMGRFDQFIDTVDLARKLAQTLLDTHPQAGLAKDELTALIARVAGQMSAVRADPARRGAALDDVEAVISTCRDLRHVLDAHQAWHLDLRQAEIDLRLLESDENRHLIGGDIRSCQQKIDDSTGKATARDHRGAAKDLATAADLRAKARLRLKAGTNQAPDKAELQTLLAAENGQQMLDEIINGLDEEAQRKVMNVAFEARFGCTLDIFESPASFRKGRRDEDLGKKAPNIQRFFKLMSDLPPASTLDNDSMLIFSHVGGEQTGSYFNGGRKEIAMREGEAAKSGNYNVGLEHELGVDPATLELQQGEQIDFFSWNTLHEVGHAVDDKLGFMNSRGEALAGWKVFGANVRPVAEAIAGDLNFDAGYLSEYISRGRGSTPPIPEPNGCTAEEWERRRREACAWVDRVRVANDPWATDSTAKSSKTKAGKVYHESYNNSWCCYDYSARAKGVSGYQFRAPGEWFSELYAAVHTKKLKPTHAHYDLIADAK